MTTITESLLIEILFIAFSAGILWMKLNTVEKIVKDHEDRIRKTEKK